MLDNLPSATIMERLRWQGFKDDYHLVGDRDTQIRQIHTALPPPMSKAIASSLCEHIDAVKQKVAELQTQKIRTDYDQDVHECLALVEKHPNDPTLRRNLAESYQRQGDHDKAIAGWWDLLCKNPFQMGIFVMLHQACYRKRGSLPNMPQWISLLYFGWLCLFSYISAKAVRYGLGKVDWWPFVTEDELMLLRPYMIQRKWRCVHSPSPTSLQGA